MGDKLPTLTEIDGAEIELERIERERERLYRAWSEATDAARAQSYLVRDLRAGMTRVAIADMDVAQLREHVADLARAHAHRAAVRARSGWGDDAVAWGPFRTALAELSRRAG